MMGMESKLRPWILLVSLLPLLAGTHSEGQPVAPPTQAPIVPNASLITAEVLKYSIWNTRLLKSDPEQTLYSLVLEVRASESVGEKVNLVKAGELLEVFSKEPLLPGLLGKTIQATVRLHGDEWGQRYWLQEIRSVVSAQGSPKKEGLEICLVA